MPTSNRKKYDTGKKMPWAQRKKELLQGLNNSVSPNLHISIGHVAEVLGLEKAQEMARTQSNLDQRVSVGRTKRIQRNTIGEFLREDLILALEAQTTDPHIKGTSNEPTDGESS